jgi:hypothetical protein
MIRRNTVIVLVVFLVVLATAIYLQKFPPGDDEVVMGSQTPDAPEFLFDFAVEDVSGMTIEDDQERRVTVQKDEDGAFVLLEPAVSRESTDAVTIFNAIISLAGTEVTVDLDSPPAPDVIGLDEPAYKITLSFEDGKDILLLVGDETLTKTGYYVTLEDSDMPKVVARYPIDTLLGWLDAAPIVPISEQDSSQ